MRLPEDLLRRPCAEWHLSAPVPVAATPRGWVFRVTRDGGRPAALKIARPGVATGEEHAATLLRAWDGRGAVRVLEAVPGAMLMEWLDGPSLGDLARRGEDDRAAHLLAGVARMLRPAVPVTTAISLGALFRPLLQPATDLRLPRDTDRHMPHARAIARSCLAEQRPGRLLHGDLHHDNVLHGDRGWCAIDPKGVFGDPGYELANALRNPAGMERAAADPDRLRRHASIYALALDTTARQVMRWAAAHCALSLTWTHAGGGTDAASCALLPRLVSMADDPDT